MFINLAHYKSKAFTLIEVLIALIIFALTFLGFAALQAKLLRISQDSFHRSIAINMASNIMERMYANIKGVEDRFYDNPNGNFTANPSCLGVNVSGVANGSSCTPQELALNDFYEWNSLLKGAAATTWQDAITAILPQASGIVCIDSTPDDGTEANPACDGVTNSGSPTIYAVKIWWHERTDNSTHRYVYAFQPSS